MSRSTEHDLFWSLEDFDAEAESARRNGRDLEGRSSLTALETRNLLDVNAANQDEIQQYHKDTVGKAQNINLVPGKASNFPAAVKQNLGNRPLAISTKGTTKLRGCTVVVALSGDTLYVRDYGIFLPSLFDVGQAAHFWEIPGFDVEPRDWPLTVRFREEVIYFIQHGVTYGGYRAPDPALIEIREFKRGVDVWILTVRNPDHPVEALYSDKINTVKATIRERLGPSTRFHDELYARPPITNPMDVLVEYDPKPRQRIRFWYSNKLVFDFGKKGPN